MSTDTAGHGDERIPTFVIRPPKGRAGLGLGELREYRDLLFFLVWRDVKVRYKQTVLGAAWAVLQPFLLMVIFSVILGTLGGLPSQGVPYPIFTYAALVPWTLFASSLVASSDSLVGNQMLISKVYFPRLVLPISAAGSFVIDFAIALVILFVLMGVYTIAPTWNVVWLPCFAILAFVTALAVGIWLSAVNVRYRDVHYAIPFGIQLWLFASPVAYSATLVPSQWQWLYGLNPMAGVAEGFRWALLGTERPSLSLLAASATGAVALLLWGTAYFHRAERTFADVI
jgi:lipopolysaccharide transport system permease protein